MLMLANVAWGALSNNEANCAELRLLRLANMVGSWTRAPLPPAGNVIPLRPVWV